MLLAVALTHPAAGFLDQHGLMIEMRPHELLQPCREKRKLDRLALDRSKPPIRYYQMVGIDRVMTEDVLSSD